MMRHYSPLHDKWHPRVEGQIRDCMQSHPEWFSVPDNQLRHFVNSLAKRIVGGIVADLKVATNHGVVNGHCGAHEDGGSDAMVEPHISGVVSRCAGNDHRVRL